MHAERLQCTVCLPSFVLAAHVVFLLERGRTQEVTDATDHPIPMHRLPVPHPKF